MNDSGAEPPTVADAYSRDALTSDVTAQIDAMNATDARSTADTAPPGCTTPLPAGVTACCGGTACVDRSGNGCICAMCAQENCGLGKLCCFGSSGNVSCEARLTDCR